MTMFVISYVALAVLMLMGSERPRGTVAVFALMSLCAVYLLARETVIS